MFDEVCETRIEFSLALTAASNHYSYIEIPMKIYFGIFVGPKSRLELDAKGIRPRVQRLRTKADKPSHSETVTDHFISPSLLVDTL